MEPLREDLGARPCGGGAWGQGDVKQSGCRDRADQVEMALHVNSITLEALGSH